MLNLFNGSSLNLPCILEDPIRLNSDSELDIETKLLFIKSHFLSADLLIFKELVKNVRAAGSNTYEPSIILEESISNDRVLESILIHTVHVITNTDFVGPHLYNGIANIRVANVVLFLFIRTMGC